LNGNADFSIDINGVSYGVAVDAASTAGADSLEQLALLLNNSLRAAKKLGVATDLTSGQFGFSFVARNGKLYLQSAGGKPFAAKALADNSLMKAGTLSATAPDGYKLSLAPTGTADLAQAAKFSLAVGSDHFIVTLAAGTAPDAAHFMSALNLAVNEGNPTKRLGASRLRT
jgi:hypothetical protein